MILFLNECRYVSQEKKIPKHIIDYVELSSDSDEETSDEEILMKKVQMMKNSNEENSNEAKSND